MTFNSTDPQSHIGKTDTWLTPLEIIESLGNNFDLDPCGFYDHKTAKTIYQYPYDDGLKKDWFGKVWLNPPYSKKEVWLDKMKSHRNGVALVFARTGVLCEYIKDCNAVFFFRKRIRFLDSEKKQAKFNPGSDSMLLIWGEQDFNKLNGVYIKKAAEVLG